MGRFLWVGGISRNASGWGVCRQAHACHPGTPTSDPPPKHTQTAPHPRAPLHPPQNDSLATLLARLEGILGPLPGSMVARGRYSHRYYTRSRQLYEANKRTRRWAGFGGV